MKLLRICFFCLVVFLGGEAAAFATSIPFTGSFSITYANSYGADITGLSFSMIGYTFDADQVGYCAPGSTCTLDTLFEMYAIPQLPQDNIYGSVDGVSGYISGGSGVGEGTSLIFQSTFTAPAFDPSTWTDCGGDCLIFDAGPVTFSGTAMGWSCTPVGSSTPCWSFSGNTEEFSVYLSGTADATYLLNESGSINDAYYTNVNGTATVTYLNDPPPSPALEPTTLLLVSSGLAALLLLGRRMRPQPLL